MGKNEVKSLTLDPDALNEYYRQFPRSESHAFRDESKQSLFNLTKIYQQIDYNDSLIIPRHVVQGRFYWKDGVKILKSYGVQIKEADFLYLFFLKKNNKIMLLKRMESFILAMNT